MHLFTQAAATVGKSNIARQKKVDQNPLMEDLCQGPSGQSLNLKDYNEPIEIM